MAAQSQRLDPFEALDSIRDAYRKYVETFQRFKNPMIQDWVGEKLARGTLIFKGPYIELNRRFQAGDSFEDLISEGLLHTETPRCFTSRPEDKSSPVVELYRHQSEAIRNIASGRNTVIATGTGSGKSFCFGIPIVSECLRLRDRGVKGVKAIIVYPMNALANSQYDEFATRLHSSGLKIALYTGDTPNSKKEALSSYLTLTGRKEPYDSELLSREEIKATPPDILLTNYVMLEYILTRFEDKEIFPAENMGVLKFLVLDEVHTYTGKQGADVAYLIRRLKQHTGTAGELVCIGTSATVQSSAGEDSSAAISYFASRLFGEEFQREFVITETYDEPLHEGDGVLPEKVLVTDDMLKSFDGSAERTRALVEALLGRHIPDDKATLREMGDLLGSQKTVQFIEKVLFKNSLSLDKLVEAYKAEIRPESSDEECRRELNAAIVAGMNTEIDVRGKTQKRIIPKIHSFFSQGREIKSCITQDAPHLNDAGEVTCPECAKKNKTRIRKTFPLVFCRACGQEYYGVEIMPDGTLRPRDIDDIEVEGEPAYIFLGLHDSEKTPPPDIWLTKTGNLHDKYKKYAEPRVATYCPECNKIYLNGGVEPCHCPLKMKVSVVAYPFLFCPSEGCGVFYDRRPREFNKLFSFGTVGRSTATDVIVSNTLNTLPEKERKILVFSDNRQDTALQAAHMNNIQKRMHFRRALYKVLQSAEEPVELLEAGDRIFKVLDREGVMPKFSRSSGDSLMMMGSSKVEENAFKEYLLFNTIIELGSSQRRNQPNLEDVGLLKISYRNLDKLACKVDLWREAQEFLDINEIQRQDFLTGFLDIMRYETAIAYEYLLEPRDFKMKVESKLDEEVLFHNELRIGQPHGYSDEADNNTRDARVYRLSWKTGRLVYWTSKVLQVDRDRAAEIVKLAARNLANNGWLERVRIRRVGELLMINPGSVLLSAPAGDSHKVCKKCGLVHHFQELNLCTGSKCQDLVERHFRDNYFRFEYSRGFGDIVPLNAAEHSAQIDGETRKNLEVKFRDPEEPLNVIVCTPTMELGIDIGKLSAVYMRNVPPSPSNYAQRAGRAGRRSQAAIVNTFCGVGSRRGPHDQYFYRYPSKIISGEISPPRFMLDNKALVRAHIHSLTLETIGARVPQKIGEILDIEQENLPLKPDFKRELEAAVSGAKSEIIRTVHDALKTEIEQYNWFNDAFIESTINQFVQDFDSSFGYFRKEYEDLKKTRYAINALGERERLTNEMTWRRTAIENKMSDMREGGKDYFTYRYLAGQGFTPNYGFPTNITLLSLDRRGKRDAEEISLQRDRAIAVSEYAPGNSIYYQGGRYIVSEARLKLRAGRPVTKSLLICPKCETYYMDDEIKTSGGACTCGASLQDQNAINNAIEMPDQFAVRRQGITSDEEERMRLGYKVSEHYHRGPRVTLWNVLENGSKILTLSYEHNGRILRVNMGTRRVEADHQEDGFTLCTACNRWIFGDENVARHLDTSNKSYHCWRNATKEDIIGNLTLCTESLHDVVTLDCEPPEEVDPENYEAFYATLAQALIQGLQISMNIDVDEVESFLLPKDEGKFGVLLYESAEGGAGILHALQQTAVLHAVVQQTREILHEFDDPEDQCERACYGCLCNYYNQAVHEILDRKLVLPFLARLEKAEIVQVDASKDGYDKLLGLCESDFEKMVLEAIHKRKLPLPTDVQKTIFDRDAPIAQADFYYERERLVVFVDGPDHEKDFVKESDRKKREKLDAMGYRIFTIRHDEDLENRITTLAEYLGV
ncbi:MAG: ski2-like helicase [Methanosaeta sp. PtaU1.Bin060]|nr:MAG: ski2-like helicase [Methanosaeta sp. PtaU1.Bin060]